jgi:hypothetical protein
MHTFKIRYQGARNTVYSPAPIAYVGNPGPLVFVVVSRELMMRCGALGALPSLKEPSFSPHESAVVVSDRARGKQALLVVSC